MERSNSSEVRIVDPCIILPEHTEAVGEQADKDQVQECYVCLCCWNRFLQFLGLFLVGTTRLCSWAVICNSKARQVYTNISLCCLILIRCYRESTKRRRPTTRLCSLVLISVAGSFPLANLTCPVVIRKGTPCRFWRAWTNIAIEAVKPYHC